MKITEIQLLVNRILEVQQIAGQHLGGEEASRIEHLRKSREHDKIRDRKVNETGSLQKKNMKKPDEKGEEKNHNIDIRV